MSNNPAAVSYWIPAPPAAGYGAWSRFALWLVALSLLAPAGCRREASDAPQAGSTTGAGSVEPLEGDTSVPPELGGPGFVGTGWTTAQSGPIGDPRAIRGGVISSSIPNWPENLRRYGTGSNTWLNYLVSDLCYESLCSIHPNTLQTLPSLATHWQVSDDNMTFRFRIDPRARWSDGKPVVADDWIATYRLVNDDTLIDPMTKSVICGKMEEPVALSKYMLEVHCKEKSWRNFLSFAGMTPLPAHELAGLTGKDYLDKYNFRYTAVSGPYHVLPEDIRKNESLILTRRNDYWADDQPSNQGRYNFEKIRFVVVRDRRLSFDKVCKGELDFHPVFTAKWWVEDVTPLDAYKRGQLIRREIFTKFPKGFQGMAYNMRGKPLDDVRVRKALAHLYDRRTLLKKFAYDQYVPLRSYYPGSDAENPENEMVEYEPETAMALLREAGFTQRDSDGTLLRDGERMSITIMYRSPAFEKYLTSYQEACRKVGVELKLNLVTPETLWKSAMERSFQVAGMAWGAVLYPNPRTSWHSSMADQPGSNNITGFKSDVADQLIEQYDAEFDQAKRTEILRQLDGEIFAHHPYNLEWYNPCERLLYWNKFGMPDYGLPRYGEYEAAFSFWWFDPERAARLKQTLKSGETMEPVPPLQVRPWDKPDAGQQASRSRTTEPLASSTSLQPQ